LMNSLTYSPKAAHSVEVPDGYSDQHSTAVQSRQCSSTCGGTVKHVGAAVLPTRCTAAVHAVRVGETYFGQRDSVNKVKHSVQYNASRRQRSQLQ
jgi:hypothetical protein